MRLCLGIVGLMLLVPLCAHAAEVFPVAKSGRGEVRYIDSLPVAVLVGSPEEIGKQHGELLTRPSAELMEFPRRVLAESGLGFFYPLAARLARHLSSTHRSATNKRSRLPPRRVSLSRKRWLSPTHFLNFDELAAPH